jgi:tetratricopeptide (TPR) repeat protein
MRFRFAVLLLLASPAFAAAQRSADGTSADVEISTAVQTPSPPPGSLASSKIRLDAQDAAGALRDAETALNNGGGADAYAARGDAKRALGRPLDQVIADYAEAAKLDPRYIEKYKGLIAQQQSESNPKATAGGKGLNGVPVSVMATAVVVGVMLLVAAVKLIAKRESRPLAPDDEEVKSGGKQNAPSPETKPADLEQPPPKEPPKA